MLLSVYKIQYLKPGHCKRIMQAWYSNVGLFSCFSFKLHYELRKAYLLIMACRNFRRRLKAHSGFRPNDKNI